jgi:hypothetical protein
VWEAKLAQSDTAAQQAAPVAAESDVNQQLAYFYSNNAYNLDAASMPPESALLLNPSYAQHMARAAAGYSHPQPQEPPVEPQYGRPQPYMVYYLHYIIRTHMHSTRSVTLWFLLVVACAETASAGVERELARGLLGRKAADILCRSCAGTRASRTPAPKQPSPVRWRRRRR